MNSPETSPQDLEYLLFQIEILLSNPRSISHNLAKKTIEQASLAVAKGQLTWEKLNTTPEQLNRLLNLTLISSPNS